VRGDDDMSFTCGTLFGMSVINSAVRHFYCGNRTFFATRMHDWPYHLEFGTAASFAGLLISRQPSKIIAFPCEQARILNRIQSGDFGGIVYPMVASILLPTLGTANVIHGQ
jgi:hypothetical protein